jgi:hypothetical protein
MLGKIAQKRASKHYYPQVKPPYFHSQQFNRRHSQASQADGGTPFVD